MTIRGAVPALGDITRTSLLALLSERPMHGYELRRVIEQRHMDQWADIQPGSIYAGLQRLTAEGLLDEAGTTRSGNRPPRTAYRITEAGRVELRRLLRRAWEEPLRAAAPVDVGLAFSMFIAPEDLVGGVEERIRRLREALEALDAAERWATAPHAAIQARIADIFEHRRRLLQTEIAWAEHVLARARAGAYTIDPTDISGREPSQ